MNWKNYTLGDCVNLLSGGTPSKSEAKYWGGTIPWVSCKDMKMDYLYDSQDHLTDVGAVNGTRLVPPGSILIVVRGMILAQHFPVAITKRTVAFNQDLKALECYPEVDPLFLFHWLRGKSYEILGLADEAAHGTKRLQTDRLKNLTLHLPPLPTQKKIAAILSAYDDLIENNTRRIKILEQMAQTLYHEWFVKFRFPGHEHTKMVDSELGLIPEGWEVVTIRDVSVYINRGIAPKYDEQSESIVINQKCIRDNKINIELARRHSKKVPEEKFIQFGDILINSTGIGTLGRVAQVYQKFSDCTVDSHVSIVRPANCVNIDYFGFALIQLQPYFDHMGVGSTGQTELSRQSIGDTNFLLPLKNLQETFSQAVSPMRHAMIGMFAKNSKLRQTRDLLLPKLISGEINVEHLEITTEDIAA